MSTGRDAHYLHAQRALEPVLAAPLEAPRALVWVPGKEVLLVGSANGAVTSVEPSFGSRTLWAGAPNPVSLAADAERVAVLSASGALEVWRRGEANAEVRAETGLIGEAEVRFSGARLAVIGDAPGGRRVHVYADGRLQADVHVPPGAALGEDGSGRLVVALSLETGVAIAPLGEPLPEGAATGHLLRFAGQRLLGVAVGGATCWEDGASRSVRLLDTSAAALTADGQTVALGTFGGLVAICGVTAAPKLRAHPPRVSAHDAPVRAMGFADRGRWLATVGENCRVWAW